MRQKLRNTVGKTIRGIAAAIRARPRVFWIVALGVFVLNLFLPVLVLSLARKPVDFFTFNPWLSRLPEWLASGEVSLGRKLEFLSILAIAWFSADNPVEGLEWGFGFFAELARVAIVVVLLAIALGVAYFGWLVGTAPAESRPLRS